MIKKVSIFFFLAILSFSVYSQEKEKWNLRDCINYAVENNIEIKQQALSVYSSEVDLNTSKSSRLPDLSAEAGQNFSFGRPPVQTRVTEPLNLANTSFSLSSSVPIFTGFRITNEIKRDELSLQAATENLKKARENMELHITSLYLKCLLDKEMVGIYKEVQKLTESQAKKTQILVQSGAVSESQLYDINSQLAKDELNLVSAENERTLSLLYLAQALNLKDTQSFDIIEPSAKDDVIKKNMMSLALPPDEVYDVALKIKPHVKEAEYRVDKSKAEIEVAKSYYWPTVSLGFSMSSFYNYLYNKSLAGDLFFAEYKAGAQVQVGESYYWPELNLGVSANALARYYYETNLNKNFFNQLNDNRNEVIGVNISIPIFNRNKTRNQVKTAKINMANEYLALDNIKLALYKEIQEAYTGAMSSRTKYIASEKALQAAQKSYDYAAYRYEAGNLTVFEFNEAITKLFSSKSERIQAKYDFLFRTKILDFYRGISINIE